MYDQMIELAKKRYQTRLADINKQRQSTLRSSGFQADFDDETGLTKNMRTDPYNKFGQYQQLNRTQALRAEEMVGMNIQRGLGTRGGLAAQNQNMQRFDFGKEDADFGQGLTDTLGGYTRSQQEEKYTMDAAIWEAMAAQAAAAAAAGGGGGDWGDTWAEDAAAQQQVAPAPVVKRPSVYKTYKSSQPGSHTWMQFNKRKGSGRSGL